MYYEMKLMFNVYTYYTYYYVGLDILFQQITTFIKVCVAYVFGLHTLWRIHFNKIFQLKGLKPKNKGHTNFYECCDLTNKVYLVCMMLYSSASRIALVIATIWGVRRSCRRRHNASTLTTDFVWPEGNCNYIVLTSFKEKWWAYVLNP